jgi:lipopolysaccharide assembly outer membrane protein LptD (OstA)
VVRPDGAGGRQCLLDREGHHFIKKVLRVSSDFWMFLLCVLLFAILGLPGTAQAERTPSPGDRSDSPVPLILDRAENIYGSQSRDRVTATGGVVAKYGTSQVQADTLYFYRGTNTLEAFGDVRLESPQRGIQTGRYLKIDLNTNEVTMTDVRGKMNRPWYISGARLEGDADTELRLQEGQFTTCNLKTPHYSIRSDQIYVYPGKRITAYHATLNVGAVPVFYTPYLSLGLRDRMTRWEIKPGYSSEDGAQLEVNYHYLLPGDTGPYTSTIYSDLRQRSGVGGGFDLGYSKNRTDGYFYTFLTNRRPTRIDEQGNEVRADTTQTLWEVESNLDHDLNSNWSVQSTVDWTENNRFNKDFQSSFGGRGIERREYDGSLVYSGDRSIFRTDVLRRDRVVERDGDVDFEVERELLPRIQYQLFSQPVPFLGRGVFYGLNSRVENSRTDPEQDRLWEAFLDQTLTKSLPISRTLGQSFQVGYEQRLAERSTPGGITNRSLGIGSFGTTSSYRTSRYSTLDLNYRIERQLNRQDSVPFILRGRDLGFERDAYRTHRLGLNYQWTRKNYSTTLRTGYDLRNPDTGSVESDSRILSPAVTFRGRLTPRLNWTQYVRYDLANERLQQSSSEFEYEFSRNFDLNLEANYNRRGSGDFLKIRNRWDWTSQDREWGIGGDVTYDQRRSEFEELNVMLRKRLHKWDFRVFFRTIRDRESRVYLTFNLIDYPSKAIGFSGEPSEQEVDFESGETQEYTP